MVSRVIFITLALVLVFSLQITIWGNLASLGGNYLTKVNWLIVCLVLIINLMDYRFSVMYVLAMGWLMDIYSNLPFAVFMLTLLVTSLILQLLLGNFFTNRSWYSLIGLGLIGTVIYHVCFFVLVSALYLMGGTQFYLQSGYWIAAGWQVVTTCLLLSLVFWLINLISYRFKPNFI